MDDGLYQLLGQIQTYAWGGQTFIPDLLGLQPEPDTAYAEYWLGAHAKAPSQLILGESRTTHLDKFIAEYPEVVLGPSVARQYDQLPYLLKVLDVKDPLSIQVHPTRSEAEAGFQRENVLGIPLDAPERNYRDRNHKPELMVALSDFWLLHGFLPEAQLLGVLQQVPEFHPLRCVFENGGYAGLYRHVMTMPGEEVDAILHPLAERVRSGAATGGWAKSSPEHWVAKVIKDGSGVHYDRGIFSIYFFNLVNLRPGQAIYQDAGIPHAYLEGQNIEVMANSDNVLRGGLTEKHVDVPELLSTIRFEGICPDVIEATQKENPFEAHFVAPTQDFCLSRIQLDRGDVYQNSAQSIEILLLMHGAVVAESDRTHLPLSRGQSLVAFGRSSYRLQASSGTATLFRVSLP